MILELLEREYYSTLKGTDQVFGNLFYKLALCVCLEIIFSVSLSTSQKCWEIIIMFKKC